MPATQIVPGVSHQNQFSRPGLIDSKKQFLTTVVSSLSKQIFCISRRDNQVFGTPIPLGKEVAQGHLATLPLSGLPRGLASWPIQKIKSYFSLVHLVPAYGVDSKINRLCVHISGLGGIGGKIPFQPGIAMGSIVDKKTIDRMEDYARFQGQFESLRARIDGLKQRAEQLEAEIDDYKDKTDEVSVALVNLWKGEKQLIADQIKGLVGELRKIHPKQVPDFPAFVAMQESPIDFEASTYKVEPRGFDSIQYSSTFLDFDESEASTRDKLKQSSSAGSVSGGYSGIFFSVSGSHSWSKAAVDRVGAIRRQGHASGVLVINALVTTRHVRFFERTRYDLEKLKRLKEKEVYILSEAVMGGAFSAIITYLHTESANRDLDVQRRDQSSESDMSGKFLGYRASGHYSQQSTDESSQDELGHRASSRVTIEFIAQGAIPQVARDQVVRETLKFADQSFQEYQMGGKEGAEGSSERRRQLQETAFAAANKVRETKASQAAKVIHSPSTVFSAYDDFSDQISSDPNAGIPIGFGYTLLNVAEAIEHENRLREMKPASAEESPQLGDQSRLPRESAGVDSSDSQQGAA